MKKFTIQPVRSWYTDQVTSQRRQAQFLSQPVKSFFHEDYHSGNENFRNKFGTVENIITTLKNQFLDKSPLMLSQTSDLLLEILKKDLPQILSKIEKQRLTVCVVPRAKRQDFYQESQLLFKSSIQQAISLLNNFDDGTDFILRHTNTRTTHLDRSGYGGDGDLPYPQITQQTCYLSNDIRGRDILLIDDLYTETVNIDEDCLQALLDCGANSVCFYALGKTKAINIYSQHQKDKLFKQTLKNTFEFISNGYSIEKISELRRISVDTVINHIKEIYEILGLDVVEQYKPNYQTLYTIKQAIHQIGSDKSLKPIYDHLNGNISYNDIKLSLIFIDEM